MHVKNLESSLVHQITHDFDSSGEALTEVGVDVSLHQGLLDDESWVVSNAIQIIYIVVVVCLPRFLLYWLTAPHRMILL